MKKCTPEDSKRIRRKSVAIVLSLVMLVTSLYAGPAFAAGETESVGAGENSVNVNAEAAQQEETAGNDAQQEDISGTVPEDPATNAAADETAGGEGTVESGEAVGTGEGTQQPASGAEQQSSEQADKAGEETNVRLMSGEKWNQTVRVVAQLSGSKWTLLKPNANGTYIIKFSTTQLRNTRTVKILISSPAECKLTYSKQKVPSNNGENFVEPELTNQTVNDSEMVKLMNDAAAEAGVGMQEVETIREEPETGDDPPIEPLDPSEDPDAIQVSEFTVDVNGTGEGYFYFTSKAGIDYNQLKGRFYIQRKRPTTSLSRTASVRTKTGTPKTIPRKYREKYFKIIKKDKNTEEAVYKYRTVTAAFELKRASGVSERGYRANQGGGCDGTYSYNALCKKGSKTYAKIIKTRLSDMKVVKVSKDLKLNHANDITYDPVNKRVVVTHNDVKRKRVTFVNPNTLKSMGYKDIKIPTTLKGATKAQMAAIKGFASVTYMTGGKYKGNYIGVISGNHNFLVLDKYFKPIEYITVNKKINGSQVYYQGADNMGDKLYIAVYPQKKSRRDFIVAYDMDGNFLGKVNLIKGYETENIFHVGNTQYMTLYRPVTKVWYTPKVVKKKVKLTKKEQKLAKPNKKGKKPKYKTVIKIVKEKHTKSVKRSYIFRMNKVTL